MACDQPWCFQCSHKVKPGSKIKERLRKKIADRKRSGKIKQKDFVCANATDAKRLIVDFQYVEDAKLFLKNLINKKRQLQLKQAESRKNNDEKEIMAPKESIKKDSKIEENKSVQRIVDFIEGKDRDVDLLKKQKNREKRARRREKKFSQKQVAEQSEVIVKPEQSKESEEIVQKSDVKNVTINHNSEEESINLTLSLKGSPVLIEKILASVIQAVPDFKKSLINATGSIDKDQNIARPEVDKENNKPDAVSEKTGVKSKKIKKKKQLQQIIDEISSNKLDTVDKSTNDGM